MDSSDVLARYDSQLRRDARADPPGRIDRDGHVVRHVDDTGGWEGVLWADLDEATADAEIGRQQDFFRRRGRPFEWKHHDYDSPADLPARLTAAGFRGEPAESLMVAEAGALAVDDPPPQGITLVDVGDAAGVDLVVGLHNEVFGVEHRWLRAELLRHLDTAGATGAAVLATAGTVPVSAARVNFHAGTDFASLWGGGTLPPWRRRGIYRALVAHRARLAVRRGFRFLTVDALSTSRPILHRLGFVRLATTTPYQWAPGVHRPDVGS